MNLQRQTHGVTNDRNFISRFALAQRADQRCGIGKAVCAENRTESIVNEEGNRLINGEDRVLRQKRGHKCGAAFLFLPDADFSRQMRQGLHPALLKAGHYVADLVCGNHGTHKPFA